MARGWIGRLFGRGPAMPSPAPERPVWLIGDVHGRLDLLAPLLVRIEREMAPRRAERPALVMLGDYVDRGPDSAGVLTLLRMRSERPETVVLMGNHERMMLDFLRDPVAHGRRWLRHGGVATAESFGVACDDGDGEAAPSRLRALAKALRMAMPAGTEEWLSALPLIWRSGSLAAVHAAMAPDAPVDGQNEEVLLWGRPDVMARPRPDGVWVAHGHTIGPEPVVGGGRIGLDTGAWKTGRLSAACVEPGGEVRLF